MKIAFLNIYNGIVERGSEIFVDELAARLSKKHQVWVFQTGEKKQAKYKVCQIGGIPFYPHQGPAGPLFWLGRFLYIQFYFFLVLLFTLKCLRFLLSEKFDWLIPINGRWQVVVCRLVRFFRGGKILISGHAGVGFEDRFNLLFGKSDVFVALTPTAFSWAKNISSKIKIIYIPNGIDINKFHPKVYPVKLPLEKPIILTISALLPYKRIEQLIEAVTLLKKTSLLVIGDGPLREKIFNLGKKMLGSRFFLIPYVAHDEIAKYYRSAKIFSLSSELSEAFGLVYLEAMACNLPIVAPDDVNRREIINGAGLFCDPEKISQYADRLQQALSLDFGDKPRRQAEKFSWEKIANQYEEVMEKN